jgi:hypothetical protein
MADAACGVGGYSVGTVSRAGGSDAAGQLANLGKDNGSHFKSYEAFVTGVPFTASVLLLSLARYIASSAARISDSASVPASG